MEPLELVHFNDVYELDESSSSQGVARFAAALRLCSTNPLVLFSGDCFSPSHISYHYKGAHMLPVLRHLQVKCATIGNHDLDFGFARLRELITETGFAWVQSNLRERGGGALGGAAEKVVLQWQGWRVGLLGLAEREWQDILGPCGKELVYEDFCQVAARIAGELRTAGCDIIIALTHMRLNNEKLLAENCPEIDLILGGHDHLSRAEMHGLCPIIKSGSDFQEFTVLQVSQTTGTHRGHRLSFDWHKVHITSDHLPDPEMQVIVERFSVQQGSSRTLARFAETLDCRFTTIRSQETAIGNLLCDIVRQHFGCDVVLINSGHVRLNGFINAGDFTEQDLCMLLPVQDDLCLVQVSGKCLQAALEEGVSKLPVLEGRFPMVSGLSFELNLHTTPRV